MKMGRLLQVFCLFLLCFPLVFCASLGTLFRKHKAIYGEVRGADARDSSGPGEPLFLTPYIERGQIDEARKLSRVPAIQGLSSYAGFFTVNASSDSNMYFWFFPAQSNKTSAPLLLWLQGGPGGSSLFGLFIENGPLYVSKNGSVFRRDITWNTNYHMLYIDNPVGTGFSFTNESGGYARDETEVGINLYSALTQFFTVYSDYADTDFYVTGESYAGKYVPAIAYRIHVENKGNPKVKINLKGVAIGDGLVDPVNMFNGYGDLLYQFGMVDENEKAHIDNETGRGVEFMRSGDFYDAFLVFDRLMNGDIYPYPTYFYNVTGVTDYYNILRTTEPEEYNYFLPYLNMEATRGAIHVGNLSYGHHARDVELHLLNDIMNSTADWLAVLMDNYKVLIYNGQLDLIVGAPITERYLQVLQWSGLKEYLSVEKKIWKVPGSSEVAGYIRRVSNFWQVVVRGAGHILPHDQPARGYDLITMFIES
jgi:vitellogenic carboxypeptidase-like protein